MSKAVKAYLADIRKAENGLAEMLVHDYPVNSRISWIKGGHVRSGIVVRHGYGRRIQVRNRASGKTYWIYATDIEGCSP